MNETQLPPGVPTLISDRYEMLSLIGRGGMADVYLATDHVLDRPVAVKLLRADTANDPMVLNRFRREARSVAGLSHPNIVAVYDTGDLPVQQGQEPLPYIVMEYVEGHSLRQIVREERLDIGTSIEIISGVCAALDHSHAKNVVHRDIKPANVMVTNDGHVKLMDFGIARAVDASATMTQTAAVVGTAQYFSPEQARGEAVDSRSDIYSTGCLAYELLTGRPPFMGDSPVSVAYQHVGEEPEVPSQVDSALPDLFDAVLLKALNKDREQRFATAGQFAAALRDAENGIPFVEDEADATVPALAIYAQESTPTRREEHPATDQHPLFAPQEYSRAAAQKTGTNAGMLWLLSIIAVAAVAIASYFVYTWYQADQERRAPVSVPEVTNMDEGTATTLLRDATFNVNVEPKFDDNVEEGKAIGTDPGAGESIAKESTVKLFISQGSEQRTIPQSLANTSEATARATLQDVGLEVGEVTHEHSATIPEGWVISTSPNLGDNVKAGSTVDLVLSTGKVVVPSVTGMSKEEAEKTLTAEDLGLKVQFIDEETSEYTEGKVFKQDPEPKQEVTPGQLITLTVAKAPEEPTPSEEPEESKEPNEPSESPQGSSKPPVLNPTTPGRAN
ncbi:Stk1 family PASTA domain-containing Ser/Thr kinase [Glutamicibacter sp. X7]